MSAAGHAASLNRKTFALKRADGEPLTRADLQYDLLTFIFADTRPVFADPHQTIDDEPRGTKVTFRDLYLNALTHSPRTSKALREKLLEAPEFGTDFAKMALLANVGRVNTTMAFFPEMRTVLRTYHPVPCLQKTDENLQDAPRIKNILKSCLLDEEAGGPPSTPTDILTLLRSGRQPPTSVVNLLFVLANHSVPVAQNHFTESLEFLDLFLPIRMSSQCRSNVFLWLCFHYLEGTSPNPFADEWSSAHPGKVPFLRVLSPDEEENADTEEEKAWSEKMSLRRREFQARKEQEDVEGIPVSKAKRPTGKSKEFKLDVPKEAKKMRTMSAANASLSREAAPLHHPGRRTNSTRLHASSQTSTYSEDYRGNLSLSFINVQPESMYPSAARRKDVSWHPRTMLEHALHVSYHTDPLYDSDEDPDEHIREDYTQRLRVLCRLRGKEPTPDPTDAPSDTFVDSQLPH